MGISKTNGILENDVLHKEWNLPEWLIVFNGDGHSFVGFDYRMKNSDPAIVYIDSELYQVVKLADTFEKFLSQLYTERINTSEIIDERKLYSKEDFEKLLKEDNSEEIIISLSEYSQKEFDSKWFGEKLLELSTHIDPSVRSEVANNVWNFLTYRLDEMTLRKLIQNFQNDNDLDTQMYAELIIEKLDYSFRQLKENLLHGINVSFVYREEIYHLNDHSDQWHLSNSKEDIQTFNSVEDLLEKATIDGKYLKTLWKMVKKV